jgi:hypothetical protein
LLYSNFELKISLDGQIGVVFICMSVMLYSLFVTLILSNGSRIILVEVQVHLQVELGLHVAPRTCHSHPHKFLSYD